MGLGTGRRAGGGVRESRRVGSLGRSAAVCNWEPLESITGWRVSGVADLSKEGGSGFGDSADGPAR